MLFNILFKIKAFSFLFQVFFVLIFIPKKIKSITYENDVYNITNNEYNFAITNINESPYIFFNEEINNENKYILIKILSDDYDKGEIPYFFISKIENFNFEENQYDYSLNEENYNKTLIIPTNYYNLNPKGFYIHFIGKNNFKEFILKIIAVNEVELKLEEKISYHFNDKENNFIIKFKNKEKNDIAFILNSANIKKLKMENESNIARESLSNVLSFTSNNYSEKIIISNFNKNFSFNFRTHIIKNTHEINELENNQYFIINTETNFTIKINNDDLNSMKRRISIISHKNCSISITCNHNSPLEKEILLSEGERENISEEVICEKPEKIKIKPNESEYQVVRIIIEKIKNYNKIIEPLTIDIYQNYQLFGIKDENIKLHTYDHSIFYKDKNEYKNEYKGIQFDIQIKSGEVRIYKELCITYPYCKKNNNTFTELFPISGYISEIFYAIESPNPISNHKNIIIIECLENDNNICEYNIGYHKINEYKRLNKNQRLIKYLEYSIWEKDNIKEDKYSIILHNNKSIILDLIVYSGEAFLYSDDPKFIDYNCKEKIYHLGSNERWFLNCYGINDNYFEYKIKIRANDYGAVYQIYVQEMQDNSLIEIFPIGMTMMNYLQIENEDKEITIRNQNSNKNYPFMIMFNPINCDLKLKNILEKNSIITNGQDVIMDIPNPNNSITYSIKKYNQTHSEENTCLFLISSNYYNGNISYFILPESKPFRVILYSKKKSSKVIFPYASNIYKPKILLRVTIYNQYPIFLSIKLCSGEEELYSIFHSKNILIGNNSEITPHKICPILINLSYDGGGKEKIIIDLNIKTSNSIPYPLKSEEFFSDIVKMNGIQYYMAIISQGSRGSMLLNFRRGSGMIYGKIFDSNPKRENNDRRFILPNKNSTDLLKYNFNEQKLYFNENNTTKCGNFCYLIIGVEPYQMNRKLNENKIIFYEYSLFLRYFNKDEKFVNFIDIQSDEFIIGNININDNPNDYFEFHFQNSANINTLIIDFQSQYCRLILAFNSKDFQDTKKTVTYEGNKNNQIFKIKKNDFISNYTDSEKDLDYLTINIKIEINKTTDNYEKNNGDYKFRMKASFDILENIITADTSIPVYCGNSSVQKENSTSYCDYIVNINKFEYYESIELYATADKKEKLEIYEKLVETNKFIESLNNGNLVSWPNKSIRKDNEEHSYLLRKELVKGISFKLLIRVYLNGNSHMELNTNLIRSKNLLLPFPKYPQILGADEKGIRIEFPKEDDYNIHFITLEGKGQVIYNKKKFTLFGNYDALIFNYKKNLKENNINLTSIAFNNSKNFLDKYYICKFRYSKMNENIPLEQITLNSGGNYIYTEQNKNIFYYYISVNKTIKENIPFNLVFNKLNSNDKDYRDVNSSETFIIKGYLMNKNQFLDYQLNGKITNNSLVKNYKGNYDLSHHQVNIFFDKQNINSLWEEKKDEIYIIIVIKKGNRNKRKYNFIHSTITVFLPNQEKRIVPINSYLTNHFEKNTNNTSHLYKLNSLYEAKEMILEFSSPNNDIKYKIINSFNNNSKNEEKDLDKFFNKIKLKKQEEIGKDIIILKKNLDQVILLVECKNSPKDNLEYTFKYFDGENYSFLYEYNPIIKKEKKNNNYEFKFNRIKYKKNSNKLTGFPKCNYYLRLFEIKKNNNKTLNNISTSFFKEKPFLSNIITYDDNILKENKEEINFIKNIKKDSFYIDIIAEILENEKTYEYLAYYRTDNNIEKKYFFTKKNLTKIGLVAGGVFILILFLIIYIRCYKKRNDDLKEKVDQISFTLGNSSLLGSETRSNNDNEDDDDDDEDEENILF